MSNDHYAANLKASILLNNHITAVALNSTLCLLKIARSVREFPRIAADPDHGNRRGHGSAAVGRSAVQPVSEFALHPGSKGKTEDLVAAVALVS